IAKANQEGALEVELIDTAMVGAGPIKDAFVNRFAPLGLNIQVNLGAGQQPPIWSAAQAAIAAGGAPPDHGVIGQGDDEILPSLKRGMLQRIDNWQELLAAIDPAVADGTVKPEDRSPEPFAGYGMIFDDRVKIILYNSEMMAKDQLPKTYLDLAEPRYKGQFLVPPWSGSVPGATLISTPLSPTGTKLPAVPGAPSSNSPAAWVATAAIGCAL